jgi:F0F1-type ATP synthase alpha subunit
MVPQLTRKLKILQWLQLLIAFFIINLNVLGSLSNMFSYRMCIGGADSLANQIYALDSFMASDQLDLDGTLGSAANPETSSIGVVLSSLVLNTNLTQQIPVGSGYAGRIINALGGPGGRIGQVEMSDFRCVESPAPNFMDRVNSYSIYDWYAAMNAVIRRVGSELIMGARDTAKSAVAIDVLVTWKLTLAMYSTCTPNYRADSWAKLFTWRWFNESLSTVEAQESDVSAYIPVINIGISVS